MRWTRATVRQWARNSRSGRRVAWQLLFLELSQHLAHALLKRITHRVPGVIEPGRRGHAGALHDFQQGLCSARDLGQGNEGKLSVAELVELPDGLDCLAPLAVAPRSRAQASTEVGKPD